MAELARWKLRAKLPALKKALTARFREHHAFLLERMLAHVDDLEADIAAITERIGAATAPFETQLVLLESIPGVGRHTAQVILAEIGTDMSVFPTEGHLASWAGMCPGQRESAGRRGSAKTRKGSTWLRSALIESARRAARLEGTYMSERYLQVRRSRGDERAVVAVAHEILIAAYRCLSTGAFYDDPGPDTLRSLSAEHVKRRALAQLRSLGLDRDAKRPDQAAGRLISISAFSHQESTAARIPGQPGRRRGSRGVQRLRINGSRVRIAFMIARGGACERG